MGCPKSFSISGGMGAALLTKPELIHDVCNAYPLKCFFFFFLFPNSQRRTFAFCTWLLTLLLSKPDFDNIKEELGHPSNM